MTILQAGIADRRFRDARPLRDALGGERGVHAALFDGQQQVFPGAAGLEGIDLVAEAGKTTALSLLYRAYDPQSGSIRVDGHDLRSLQLDSLRRNIGVVFQEPGLFYRSIADNLRVAAPAATQAQVEAAARAAQAHDFISAKPEGYDTLVAERGRSLSGGERQRLAIARAMLKDAPILILDEATSALDTATEENVIAALQRFAGQKTIIMVAHRETTLRQCDAIYRITRGRIELIGSHAALLGQATASGASLASAATTPLGLDSRAIAAK